MNPITPQQAHLAAQRRRQKIAQALNDFRANERRTENRRYAEMEADDRRRAAAKRRAEIAEAVASVERGKRAELAAMSSRSSITRAATAPTALPAVPKRRDFTSACSAFD